MQFVGDTDINTRVNDGPHQSAMKEHSPSAVALCRAVLRQLRHILSQTERNYQQKNTGAR